MAKLFGMIPLAGDGAEKTAIRNAQAIAGMYNTAFNTYYPKTLAELWKLYTNPNSPFLQAQMNTLQANSMRDYQGADTQLQRALAKRGIGKSSFTGNNIAALWNAYGQAMANARQQQMGTLDQRRQQALNAMLGLAGTAGQNALGAWQNAGNLGAARGQGIASGLMGLLNLGMTGIPNSIVDWKQANNWQPAEN